MITRRSMFSLVTATLISPAALACSRAAERGSLQAQVLRAHKDASVVVLARVVDSRFQSASVSPFGESPAHRARLEVLENWKGKHEPGSLLETTASTSVGACGVALTLGDTYLLYLHDREPYDLSSSRRNARLDDASQDIQILRSHFGRIPS